MTKTASEISFDRWKIAQDSEKDFWKDFNSDISQTFSPEMSTTLEKYFSNKANILIKNFEKFIKIKKDTKILQIGCASIDVINYIAVGDRYSIDPLADFYKEKFKIDYKKTKFVKGMAEELPYPDNFFDIIIYDNVLDHVYQPEKTMSEIKRVLKKDGVVFFACHFYQKNFIRLAKIYGFFRKAFHKEIFNIHHPYMFTVGELKKIVSADFKILSENVGEEIGIFENFEDLKEKKRSAPQRNVRIPAKLGLWGIINYSCFLRKNS